ncbi:oligosaccharide flippase family protein [Alteromonas gilva]|uniref:Oligosaccharide flippase family protein n=1 Tax=Alteromonas gilva TaxID=2987522 RepID=A0ABT5KY51_9ALTE|nr:oligosaccharide flippase family protein [Alteromonas gilva]MDC8829558.1 oligosaccharide flippase family protein [Alteromonas gilva]
MKKNLFSDAFFYSLIQISNFLIPVITLPYVTRVVGVDNYGLLEIAFVFTSIFVIAIKYGFEYTATRTISKNADNNSLLSKVFYEYLYAKLIILLFCFTMFFALSYYVEIISKYKFLFFITFITIIGDFLIPGWFLRGVGKVKTVAIFLFFSKLLTLPLIFLLITESDDFYYRAAIASFSHIVISIFCIFYTVNKFNLNFIKPKLKEAFARLSEGFPLFISGVLILLTGNYNLFFMESFGNFSMSELGNYAAGQKLIQITQNVVMLSISQVFYPYFSKLVSEDIDKFKSEILSVFKLVMPIIVVGTFILYFLADFACSVMFGKEFVLASDFLRIFSVLPLLYFVSNLFLFQGVSNLVSDKFVMYTYLIFAVVNLVGLYYLIQSQNVYYVAFFRIAVQMTIAIFSVVFYFCIVKRRKSNI